MDTLKDELEHAVPHLDPQDGLDGLVTAGRRAEDLLQTALVKLYVAWPRVKQPEAYVRTTMVRANIDESRRPWRRETSTEDVPELARPDPEPEGSGLFAALQELPAMQRKVVVLRHWLDLSVAQTADELGISTGAVKTHSHRALAALRASRSLQGVDASPE
jgi:RNA polymerase sigma-70 factor (sigma-E family)